jgi:hypothetical protein
MIDKISQDFTSFNWWISVVAVGIIVHLAAAYLKAPIDRCLSAMSRTWATRSARRRRDREARIQRLRASPAEQALASMEALHIRVRGLLLILLGFIVLTFAVSIPRGGYGFTRDAYSLIGIALSLFVVAYGFNDWVEAARRQGEVREARESSP